MPSANELQQRGFSALEAGRLDEAETCYRSLLAMQEHHPGLLNNLGLALAAQRRFAEAVSLFELSLAARPGHVNTLVALSNALNFCNRPADAIARCDEILAVDPQSADARHNKIVALRALNRHREAIAELKALLARNPDDPDAQFNLALSELSLGEFEPGWRHYEARWRGAKAQPALPLAHIAYWEIGEDLRGRTVLVQAEQGLGDTLQFIRYVARLALQCRALQVQVQAPLVDFVRRLLPQHEVDALGETPRGAAPERRIALLSLPLALQLFDEPSLAPDGAYLHADRERASQWRSRVMSPDEALRVGFAWRGRPTHRNDHNRSLGVEAFEPWLTAMAKAGATVFALQKDVTAMERDWLGRFAHVRVPGEALADFDDTAALIAHLDHVLTVDTSIAHLAGGMARPATVLLPFSPDWRWGLGRDRSAFYPSIGLLRQDAIGDWSGALARLVAASARWERVPR